MNMQLVHENVFEKLCLVGSYLVNNPVRLVSCQSLRDIKVPQLRLLLFGLLFYLARLSSRIGLEQLVLGAPRKDAAEEHTDCSRKHGGGSRESAQEREVCNQSIRDAQG